MIISYSAFYLLRIITEYKFLEISRMPGPADMHTKELSAAFY